MQQVRFSFKKVEWISKAFAIAFFVLIVAAFINAYFVMEGHAVASHALAQLKIGMTIEEADALLGSRTSITGDDSNISWYFSRRDRWCIVTVHFSKGQVVEIVHDH